MTDKEKLEALQRAVEMLAAAVVLCIGAEAANHIIGVAKGEIK